MLRELGIRLGQEGVERPVINVRIVFIASLLPCGLGRVVQLLHAYVMPGSVNLHKKPMERTF